MFTSTLRTPLRSSGASFTPSGAASAATPLHSGTPSHARGWQQHKTAYTPSSAAPSHSHGTPAAGTTLHITSHHRLTVISALPVAVREKINDADVTCGAGGGIAWAVVASGVLVWLLHEKRVR